MTRMLSKADRFYIGGEWVEPHGTGAYEAINPATEEPVGVVTIADRADVDRAVAAARTAFASFSQTSVEERVALLRRIAEVALGRQEDLASRVTAEMGAPISFSRSFHARGVAPRFDEMATVAANYAFAASQGTTLVAREAIGVCGAISPWNVPVTSIAGKLAPALAAGCTVVVKPSEIAAFSPLLLMEILHDAGVPPGVVNLLNGDGGTTGAAMASHSDIDLVNFTGSTRAGVSIGKAAADTVKRVLLELGGKSPSILLPDADLDMVVPASVQRAFVGSGQSCQAPTRLLVHRSQHAYVEGLAAATAAAYVVGNPQDPSVTMGPVASRAQFDKVRAMISAGIDAGATLATGGLARPDGLDRGYFVRPTIFSDVSPSMRIAQEEIFGPVLSILPYDDLEQAIDIANGTEFGLASWVYSADLDAAKRVARRIRAGRVYLNGAPPDPMAPFGGYKLSGNSREGGVFGLEAHLEVKAILGYDQVAAKAQGIAMPRPS